MRSQGGDEAGFGDVAGAELEDERPHLGQGIPLELAQGGELGRDLRGVPLEEHLGRARQRRHREERLGDRVVQLASEVGTLLAGSQLGGLAAQVAVESLALAHVARRPVSAREAAVSDHADAGHLERQLPAILGHHR